MVVCVGGVEWSGQLYACHRFVREGVGAGGGTLGTHSLNWNKHKDQTQALCLKILLLTEWMQTPLIYSLDLNGAIHLRDPIAPTLQ